MLKCTGMLVLLLSMSLSVFAQEKDAELVKAAFEKYKTAILNDRGEEAVKYVDSRTIKYYNEVSEKVRKSDSTTIESMGLLDKLMVFSIRHRASREDILGFDGKKLFIFAIREGMVGKNSVANNGIGKVTVNDQFAKGQLVVNNSPAPIDFHFYKEDNQWKLDLTALFPVSENAFKQIITESELSDAEFLFNILETLTGTRPGNEIWKPVLK